MSSIASLALRIAALRLLKGATSVEDRVFDSAISTIDEMITEQPRGFIVVATEDERAGVTVHDVLSGERSIDLVIDIAIAGRVTARVDGEEATTVVIPETDGGIEMSLALVARQVMRALFAGPGPWSSVFRAICPAVRQINTRRGAGSQGTRFAARQIVFTVDPIDDPAFGVEPENGTAWAKFLAQVEADPELAAVAPAIRAAIVGDEIPSWQQVASVIGLADEAARGIGIMSANYPSGEPSELSEVEIEGIGPVTAVDIAEQLPNEGDS